MCIIVLYLDNLHPLVTFSLKNLCHNTQLIPIKGVAYFYTEMT